MSMAPEILAEIVLDKMGIVVANDSARSSFTVASGDSLLAVDADLHVLNRWPVGPLTRRWHATSPDRGRALISGAGEVRLLDRASHVIWIPYRDRSAGSHHAGLIGEDDGVYAVA